MMRRGIKKVEMVDAWTQTSPRNNDEEEKKKQAARAGVKPGEHSRTASGSANNGGFLFSDTKNKPRASMEHIYNANDPKQL